MQNDILVSLTTPMREEVVRNNKRLLDCARATGITVIFVGVCFRAGCVSEKSCWATAGSLSPNVVRRCVVPTRCRLHYPQSAAAETSHAERAGRFVGLFEPRIHRAAFGTQVP